MNQSASPLNARTLRSAYGNRRFIPAPGARIKKRDAAVIGRRFAIIYERKKKLTPDLVVEDAKLKSSPLNRFFEWDQVKAATAHWIERARYLLRSVWVYVVVKKDSESTSDGTRSYMPKYVRDGNYYPTPVAFSRVDAAEAIVRQARSELEGWIRRYEKYGRLAGAVASARSVLTQIQ